MGQDASLAGQRNWHSALVTTLNEDLWGAILTRVSLHTGALRHALVCRAWARLALRFPGPAHAHAQLRRFLAEDTLVQLEAFPCLTSVFLDRGAVHSLSNSLLLQLAQGLPRLKRLHIERRPQKHEDEEGVSMLHSLFERVTVQGVIALIGAAPHLAALHLMFPLSSDFFPWPGMPRLQRQDADRVWLEAALVGAHAANLRSLSLTVYQGCTPEPLDGLLHALPALKDLFLDEMGPDLTRLQCSATELQALRLPVHGPGLTSLRRLTVEAPQNRGFHDSEQTLPPQAAADIIPGLQVPWEGMPWLRSLALTCASLDELPALPRLQHLELQVGRGATLPRGLEELPSLTDLDISSSEASSLPEGVAALARLKTLRIAMPMLQRLPAPGPWGPPPRLQVLHIKSQALVGVLGTFCWSPSVEHVELCMERAADWPDCIFEGLDHLLTLRMVGDWIKHLPGTISSCTSLRRLELDAVSLQGLPDSLAQLTKLETLSIRLCKAETLEPFLPHLSALQELSIYCMLYLTSLGKSLAGLKELHSLTLEKCPRLRALPGDLKVKGRLKKARVLRCGVADWVLPVVVGSDH